MPEQGNPILLLERAVKILETKNCQFALCGGLAASIYRSEPRVTQDVDFTLLASSSKAAQKLGVEVLTALDLNAGKLTEATLTRAPQMNKRSSPLLALVGRTNDSPCGVDFLFDTYPWVNGAMERTLAIDFKFARVPVLAVEDLLVSKAYAISKHEVRYKDLDDFENIILNNKNEIDLLYLVKQFDLLSLSIPKDLEKKVPKQIARISKEVRRR